VVRRSIALKIPIAGIAAGVTSLIMFAGAASAHTAEASVQRECARSTVATVTVTNDYDLDAVVSFSGAASGSSSMAANGSTSVHFTLSDPSTLTYSVTWSDGFKQGPRSVSVDPLTNCVITATTTPTTTPTTAPPPTEAPTTVPPETAPPTTVATTTPTVLGVELRPETAAAPKATPRAVPAPAQLPATGRSDAVPLVAVGAVIVVTGVLLVAVRRLPRSS
jgi:LPXTG-motif cell wall-anchored protein